VDNDEMGVRGGEGGEISEGGIAMKGCFFLLLWILVMKKRGFTFSLLEIFFILCCLDEKG
jgi:hypothetical protein